jgi:hypothetical protein
MGKLQASRTEGQISHEQYVTLLKAVGERSKQLYGTVWGIQANSEDGYYHITYYHGKEGDKWAGLGSEDIDISCDGKFVVKPSGVFVEAKQVKSDLCTLIFGTVNGKPTMKRVYNGGAVEYWTLDYSDTEHNQAFITYMCTP